MIFGKRNTRPTTFDDVASDEVKALRAAIFAASNKALIAAGGHAALGDAKSADDLMNTARILRLHAISIPLDMVEAGIDLKNAEPIA